MSARLHVDWTACDGRGLCVELLPELLDRDEWGYPLARDGTPEPTVPAALAEHARRAVGACPKLALKLLSAS
jgi:ferredoxin